MTPIKSSMATHADYDMKTGALTVKFKNGSTHLYRDVPAHVGESLMGAQSFGSSFNKNVAGHYIGEKI